MTAELRGVATTTGAPPQPAPEPVNASPSTRHRRAWPLLVASIAASVPLLLDRSVPWLTPVAGLWLLLGLPTYLLSVTVNWRATAPGERLVYSLATTIVALFGVGLGLDLLLPLFGATQPLARGPVTVGGWILCAGLTAWRPVRHPLGLRGAAFARLDLAVLSAATLVVLLAVMGANRLNNGAGGGLTVVMLGLAAAVFVALIARRATLTPATLVGAVYLLGLALLLMTSLRGWTVTGHDVQREVRVFALTAAHGDWSPDRFRDAYNACLSITILPTMLQRVTGIADAYVYKVVFQLIFAACPVMVYHLARRFVGTGLALVAALYFVAFPTYFSDMPFLNRQEIAFLFVGALLLMATNGNLGRTARLGWLAVFSVGMVLAHYSTTYVTCAALAVALAGPRATRLLVAAVRRSRKRVDDRVPAVDHAPVVGAISVVFLIAATFLWNFAITNTSQGLGESLGRAVQTVLGRAETTSSSDVRYGLLSTRQPTDRERLAEYERSAERWAGTDPSQFYPQSTVDSYDTPVVGEAKLAPTGVGALLDAIGIDVGTVNEISRQGAAKMIQLFVLVGLVVAARGSRRITGAGGYLWLGWACMFVVALQVALPGISADYGVLRAFQQALFVCAPFLAVGSAALVGLARRSWALRGSVALAVVFFVSLTGVVPQVLGGYPPQLHLNNAGRYYDIYYVHPQERAATAWLLRWQRPDGVQSEVQTDRYVFAEPADYAGIDTWNDIYPDLIRRESYVFLGVDTVRRGESTVSTGGDLITYRYPIEFLATVKSRVYCADGVQIYR